MIIPLILSGGAGSRLWPLSRELFPKQFHQLVGEQSLLQDTLLRLRGVDDLAAPMVVCNQEHRFMVAEHMREIGVQPLAIYLEPVGRNTAPAVAVGALRALEEHADPVLLVLPADHMIARPRPFVEGVAVGARLARADHLVTFGITPQRPETGFGYIKQGEPISVDGGATAFRVERFVEKPDEDTARGYLESGGYFWNSGMFMFRASRYLMELERWEPEMLAACRDAYMKAREDLDFVRLDQDAFERCPGKSIDFAVMERSDAVAFVPLDIGWSDVGSWTALWEAGERDVDGNVVVGDVLTNGVRDCYLHSEGRLIAALGLSEQIVVETDDAVLVAHKSRAQDVKEIVNMLKQLARDEGLVHRRVFRPWGAYQGVDRGDRFQVKRLIINPGAKLSLQLHNRRAEHWVVVRGSARVVRGDHEFELHEDESTYIPLGTRHQLENIGSEPLEIIEVQTGGYLGEDDIVRFEDRYGRA
jgi:mannose-1-phosphate guanylyltransferase/mannose-6-phosphate isomerase